MIPAYLLTVPGLEGLAQKEVSELAGTAGEVKGAGVFFKGTPEQVCVVAYRSQLAVRVVAVPSFFEIQDSLESLRDSFLARADLEGMRAALEGQPAFRVECSRAGEHGFRSMDAAAEIGSAFDAGIPAQLGSSSAVIALHIDGAQAVAGVDLCGFDIAKRYYKIFPSPSSLKGPIAAALERLSGDGAFLDPLCGSGEPAIERALRLTGRSVRHYQQDALLFRRLKPFKNVGGELFAEGGNDISALYAYDPHMPHVVAAKKNAKIAGVQKAIRFGRSAIEWLDTKFSEHELDSIACSANRLDRAKLDALFYQLAFVLKRKGTLAVAGGPDPLPAAAKHGFSLTEQLIVGRSAPMTLRVFSRN